MKEYKEYRGYRIHDKIGYPAIMCPEHPLAYNNGSVYVHRAEWFLHHGAIPHGFHVHHKDHDKYNWAIENLELLSASDHAWHHLKKENWHKAVDVPCELCGIVVSRLHSQLIRNKRIFCSKACRIGADKALKRTVIAWPAPEKVAADVRASSCSAVARILGVSDNGVRKYLKRHNIRL